MAISDPGELGMMTGMVTSTQNDQSAELLAHARRGPCAVPTEREKVEYLLKRRRPRVKRARVTDDATAAVLSFQRRTHALKDKFLVQYRRTPLGIISDYWDRTEAQQRGALHSHILFWTKRRKLNMTSFTPMPTTCREGWAKADLHGAQAKTKKRDMKGKTSNLASNVGVTADRKETQQTNDIATAKSSHVPAQSRVALSSGSLGSGASISAIAEPVLAVGESTEPAPTTCGPGLQPDQ